MKFFFEILFVALTALFIIIATQSSGAELFGFIIAAAVMFSLAFLTKIDYFSSSKEEKKDEE